MSCPCLAGIPIGQIQLSLCRIKWVLQFPSFLEKETAVPQLGLTRLLLVVGSEKLWASSSSRSSWWAAWLCGGCNCHTCLECFILNCKGVLDSLFLTVFPVNRVLYNVDSLGGGEE